MTYKADFFEKYAPVSALDMVRNLPGFELDNGNTDTRGFGSAAGNVLINGERISAKNDVPSNILARIPAADIKEIIVLRGQIGGLDLVGQSVIANVIRKGDSATGTWSVFAAVDTPDDNLQPYVELTYTDTVGELNYTLGIAGGEYQGFSENDEVVVDENGQILQERDEVLNDIGDELSITLNTTIESSVGKFNVNTVVSRFDEQGGETSIRQSPGNPAFSLFQGDVDEQEAFEIGIDFERTLGKDWNVKLIGLKTREDTTSKESLVRGPVDEEGVIETETFINTVDTEEIARLELDYLGFDGHLIEFSLEGARNGLDSEFKLSELDDGQLRSVDVPGAETKVEEKRVEFTLSDSFSWRDINVDVLLGAESSTIKQTGGFAEDRSFFFWKPSLSLSYSPDLQTQYRARVLRTVGQLDFFDFVSQADLGDVELSLGNPNLVPETTITFDLSLEKRFSDFGLLSLTAFHDEIDDVVDLLPLEGVLEIPGNIGEGQRTGVKTELTLPLDAIGLRNGRVDVSGSWQDSSVIDPLSGESRPLSGERAWEAEATIRQDMTDRNLAWSITAYTVDDRPQFGLDELDRDGKFYDFDAFIESRAFEGMRIRIGVENVLRNGTSRDRQVFSGPRTTAPLEFRELRERSFSREWFINVSGTF